MKIEYAEETYLMSSDYGYWGGRAKCPDGVVRKIKRIASQPDTFFSIPCAVDAFGKTVTGFVTTDRYAEGDTDGTEFVVSFIPYKYGVNGEIFNDRERKESATTDATS